MLVNCHSPFSCLANPVLLLTSPLPRPSLRSNSIGPSGAKALADALKKNQVLLSLK